MRFVIGDPGEPVKEDGYKFGKYRPESKALQLPVGAMPEGVGINPGETEKHQSDWEVSAMQTFPFP